MPGLYHRNGLTGQNSTLGFLFQLVIAKSNSSLKIRLTFRHINTVAYVMLKDAFFKSLILVADVKLEENLTSHVYA